uniref:Core shell protein Gag P30 domain-containing protein n=1 Tax=Catharus ustulatus TaxID=91951 RepID=A0A8C3V397_CATUS
MIHYCMEVWGGQKIRADNIYWPVFGSPEDWICQALNLYVNSKEPFSQEEREYAALWVANEARVRLFVLNERKKKKKSREDKDFEYSPPPYQLPPLDRAPALPPDPPVNSIYAALLPLVPDKDSEFGPDSLAETRRILFPLKEVPMGMIPNPNAGQVRQPAQIPGVGYIASPLNSGDVRDFKKEMKHLLEDPLGVGDRLDQFLGPNIYTWDELQAILSILFTPEEREIIWIAGMRIWDRDHQAGPQADVKWPIQKPNWDNQNPEHQTHMADLRAMIIQGVKESVPRGRNVGKAFSEQQKQEENHTEWLERLKKSFQLYSGVDPNSEIGQALLKTQFVAKSWPDIRKKLEKQDDWQDKGLDELVKEVQRVYIRRSEEAEKRQDERHERQMRIMVAAIQEGQRKTFPKRDEVSDS